jgi:cyclic pyranopterin phosphate synthase
MPDDEYDFTPASKLMQADEIEAIAKIFVQLGVDKIRLTGGEPLVRKDFGAIISKISALPVNLTITTNGSRLNHFAEVLKEAGIKSLNISLDTLQKEKFLFFFRMHDNKKNEVEFCLLNDCFIPIKSENNSNKLSINFKFSNVKIK